jgi:hypothetical protein
MFPEYRKMSFITYARAVKNTTHIPIGQFLILGKEVFVNGSSAIRAYPKSEG